MIFTWRTDDVNMELPGTCVTPIFEDNLQYHKHGLFP